MVEHDVNLLTVYNRVFFKETLILLELKGDEVIPEVYDLCASIQYAITRHICTRVQRAIEFINRADSLQGENRTLVSLNKYLIYSF